MRRTGWPDGNKRAGAGKERHYEGTGLRDGPPKHWHGGLELMVIWAGRLAAGLSLLAVAWRSMP